MTAPTPDSNSGPLTRVSPPNRSGDDRPTPPPWKVEGAPGGAGGSGTPNKQRPIWMRFGWMLLVLLALNWIVSSFILAPAPRTAVSYTYFLTQVDARNIADITSTGDTIEGSFTKKASYTPTGKTKAEQVDRFTTQRPSFANDNLFAKLQANGVPVNANPPDAPAPVWQQLLVGFGPTILLVGLLVWFMRRAAEEVVYGDATTGAESDLDQVSNIARQMVGRWGMSDAVGPMTVLPQPGTESPFGNDGIAQATKELMDSEVRKIVDECYADALELLRGHRDQLSRLAHRLVESETLDEDDAYAAAGIARETAPGALARGEVPGRPPAPGMPPEQAPDQVPDDLPSPTHANDVGPAGIV